MVIVVIAAVGALAVVPESTDPNPRPIDLVGTVLSVVAFTAITYGVISVPRDGWSSADALIGLGGGVVALALFLARQALTKHPMVTWRSCATPGSSAPVAPRLCSCSGSTACCSR
ncbi:hypothetical protein ABH927_000668 [Planotetraspora sp. GP83]